jgi:hypothetical protein
MWVTREALPAGNLSSQHTFDRFLSKQSETLGSLETGSYTPDACGILIVRFQRSASKTGDIAL